MRVIICDGLDAQVVSALKQRPEVDIASSLKWTREQLLKDDQPVHTLIIRSATHADQSLLTTLHTRGLKWVIRAGEGLDNVDQETAKHLGIEVSNTPGANGNAAAELAIAHLFALLRMIPQAHHSMVKGEWEKQQFAKGLELTGKTLGIIGFGKIGQTIAKRLKGFELTTLYFDPFCSASEWGEKVKTLEELFERSQLLTLHLPAIPATKHLIDRKLLERLQVGSLIVNCARGGIIKEDHLLEVLNTDRLRGCALDVFEVEPLPAEHPLRTHPKVILTPHLGASTLEAQARVGQMVLDMITAKLNSK